MRCKSAYVCVNCHKRHKPFLIKHTVGKSYVIKSPLCAECFNNENKKNWEVVSE